VWVPRAKWTETLGQPLASSTRRLNNSEPWPKKAPRKPRADKGLASSSTGPWPSGALPKALAARPLEPAAGPKAGKRAADAAELAAPAARAKRRCHAPTRESAAQRLAAGRTLENLRDLMRTHLFSHQGAPAVFCPGSFAKLDAHDVFVLGAFTRRGCAMVDVARLERAAGSDLYACSLSSVQTRARSELQASAGSYLMAQTQPRSRSVLHFHQQPPGACPPQDAVERLLAASVACHLRGQPQRAEAESSAGESAAQAQPAPTTRAVKIAPAACAAHVEAARAKGEQHAVSPRQDRGSIRFVLDLPLPAAFEARPYRCDTCRRSNVQQQSFPVTDADVRAAFPGVGALVDVS
jgi:hypothetical protein